MTRVAAAGADRSMTRHAPRVGCKTRRGIGVTVAALDPSHRNMRRRGQSGRRGAVVATRAIGVGRSMRERAAQPCDCALMASLAWQCRRYVVRGLAQRRSAVVATGAGRRNSSMIHDGRAAEAHRALVAISARRGGDDMVGGFSNSEGTIMATRARTGRLAVIDETHLLPRRRKVAAFANVGRLRVGLRLARSRRTIVAGETLPGRSLEASADMTRRAIDTRMRARERKSRQKMIERRGRRGLRMAARRDKQNCPGNDQQLQT